MSKQNTVDQIIDRNVQALIDLRKKHDAARGPTERALDHAAGFIGSAFFIYLHVAAAALWFAFRPFPFDVLAGCASVEAIFLSTLLMSNQNRLRAHELKREDLELQVSLLIEHELTRLGRVCDHIAEAVGAGREAKREKGGLTEDIPATKVLERIEAVEKTNEEEKK
ncbi:MAG: DUF1003 domain-containing protein [Bdellovibrionota bacterium]